MDTLASAHVGNRTLSADPKRIAVIGVWEAVMRGAHKYCKQESGVPVYNVPHVVGSRLAGLIRQSMKLHSSIGVGRARVVQFILGQTDIRVCMPWPIYPDNVM